MRRRKLNDEQMTWLYNHYADDGMTAQMLADELSKMVAKSSENEIRRLNAILPSVENEVHRDNILAEIKFLQENKVITVADVRRYKYKYRMPNKSANHISEQNRRKASITNLNKWLGKAEEVSSILDYLKAINDEVPRVIKARDEKQYNSIRSTISKWNGMRGYKNSMFFSTAFDRQNMLVRIQPRRNRG